MLYQRSESTGEGARLLKRLDRLNEQIHATDAHIAVQLQIILDLTVRGSPAGAAQSFLKALDGTRDRVVAERDRIRGLLDQV